MTVGNRMDKKIAIAQEAVVSKSQRNLHKMLETNLQ
jgi:hypothetical protein